MCYVSVDAFSANKEPNILQRERDIFHEIDSMHKCRFLTIYFTAWVQTLFYLMVWSCIAGRCISQCLVMYHYIITNHSLLIITNCTVSTYPYLCITAYRLSFTQTHFRIRLVNLSLPQRWKTKPALKKIY